jgi:uncharacterized protein YjbI with pentapeptide repeats
MTNYEPGSERYDDIVGETFRGGSLNNRECAGRRLVNCTIADADVVDGDWRLVDLTQSHVTNLTLYGVNVFGLELTGAQRASVKMKYCFEAQSLPPGRRRKGRRFLGVLSQKKDAFLRKLVATRHSPAVRLTAGLSAVIIIVALPTIFLYGQGVFTW